MSDYISSLADVMEVDPQALAGEDLTWLDENGERVGTGGPMRGRSRFGLRKIASGLAALLVLSFLACHFISDAYLHESTDDAQVTGHIIPMSARVNGQIVEVRVVEGQAVQAGDVLAVIDPADYRIAMTQARAKLEDSVANASSARLSVPVTAISVRATLDSARAAVATAKAGVTADERNVESAKANVEQAEATAAKSDADLARFEKLVAKEDISRQQYDQAVAAARANKAIVLSAKAAELAAEQAVAQARGRLQQAQNDVLNAQTAPEQLAISRAHADASDAQVAEHQAELSQAELNLGYTVVRSPVTGVVGKRSVELNQNVSVGQELFSVVPLDDVWVTANFKETQLAHMKPGQEVEIKVDATGRKWKGRVSNLGGGTGSVFSLLPPENATGNYVKVVQRVPVRIDFDRSQGQSFNVDGSLTPGMSVVPVVVVR